MPEPLWTIIGITDTTQFEQGIGPVQSKRIDFKVMSGHTSYITVPLSQFTKENVAHLIQTAAENLIDVLMLEGPNVMTQQEIG
jgi:hypothetical protein